MKVERLRSAYARLAELTQNGGTPEAIAAVLHELDKAISELESKPQTYVNTEILSVPPHWKQWTEPSAFATPPYVRVDGLTIGQLKEGGPWYAVKLDETGNSVFVMDKSTATRSRRRFWKYSHTAMAYLDRDFPSDDKRTWAQIDEALNARSQ